MNIVDYLIFKDFIFPIIIIILVIVGFLVNEIRIKIKDKILRGGKDESN